MKVQHEVVKVYSGGWNSRRSASFEHYGKYDGNYTQELLPLTLVDLFINVHINARVHALSPSSHPVADSER